MRPIVAALLVLAACGGSGAATPDRGTPFLQVEMPATIVGELEITVEEGPVGDDDLSELNFGAVDTSDGLVLVEVPAEVVRAAGLGRDELYSGGRYRVELGGLADHSSPDVPTYRVAALTPDD